MIKALILTLIIENGMLFILGYKNYRIYVFSIIINTVTNLALNYFLLNYPFQTYLFYATICIVLESLIVLIEGCFYLIYFKSFKNAIKISFILNLTSFLIGLILNFFQNFDLIKEIFK